MHEGDNRIVIVAENALGHKWNAVVYVKLEKLGEFSKIYKGAIAVRPGYSRDPSIFFVFLRDVDAQGDELKGEMYMTLNVDEFKEKYAAVYEENKISEDEEEKIKGRWIRTVFHRKPETNDFAAGPYLMSSIPLYRPEVAEGLSIEAPIMVGRPGEDIYFKPDDGNPVKLGSLSFAKLIVPRHVAKLAAATGKNPSYKATLIYSDDIKEDSIKLFLPAGAVRSNKNIDLTDKFKKAKDNVMTATIGPDKMGLLFGRFGAVTCDVKEKKPVKLTGDYALPVTLKFSDRKVSEYFVISELISEAKAYNETNENIQESMKAKDWKAAARLSNKSMKDFKDYKVHFSYMLAVSYYGMEDHKNAIKHFNTVLRKYPTHPGALWYKAWCYFRLKRAKEAIATAKRMILFSGKDDPGGNWILTCVYCYLKKDYKTAKIYCALTLKGAPNHGQAKKLFNDLNRVVR